jgi:hypothetical protein
MNNILAGMQTRHEQIQAANAELAIKAAGGAEVFKSATNKTAATIRGAVSQAQATAAVQQSIMEAQTNVAKNATIASLSGIGAVAAVQQSIEDTKARINEKIDTGGFNDLLNSKFFEADGTAKNAVPPEVLYQASLEAAASVSPVAPAEAAETYNRTQQPSDFMSFFNTTTGQIIMYGGAAAIIGIAVLTKK